MMYRDECSPSPDVAMEKGMKAVDMRAGVEGRKGKENGTAL